MLDQLTARTTLRQAFVHVRDNAGCPGADGMSVHDFGADLETEIGRLQDRLLRRRYQPFPLLRFAVAKRGGAGVRHLSVPTVRDRVVQTAAHLVTGRLFEAQFEESSHAYRHGRSVRTAIHRVRELRDQGYRYLVDADVDGFFDHLPHERLFARLRRLPLELYRSTSVLNLRLLGRSDFRQTPDEGALIRTVEPANPRCVGPKGR